MRARSRTHQYNYRAANEWRRIMIVDNLGIARPAPMTLPALYTSAGPVFLSSGRRYMLRYVRSGFAKGHMQ